MSLTIEGRGVVITSDINLLSDDVVEEPWQKLMQADSLIKVLDEVNKICFVPFKNSDSSDKRNCQTKIQVTQWFRAPTYEVSKIDRYGIYFIAPELKLVTCNGRNGYNVNLDYLYSGRIPRFRLYNKTKERKCTATQFIKFENSNYKSISIEGLSFKSNKSGNWDD